VSWRADAKKRVAIEAVKHVQTGDIVGLGSGSTAAYAIREIGKRIHYENLKIEGIATSSEAERMAIEEGIKLTNLDVVEYLDVAIDGADQVDPDLNLIKGLGAALTREKIVDDLSKVLVIIVDETKLTNKLGTDMVVPVEVLPFALSQVSKRLEEMGGTPLLRSLKDGKPLITDNNNYIVDVDFGPIDDPGKLREQIKLIPGVLENGLFIDMADLVYVGSKTGIKKIERK